MFLWPITHPEVVATHWRLPVSHLAGTGGVSILCVQSQSGEWDCDEWIPLPFDMSSSDSITSIVTFAVGPLVITAIIPTECPASVYNLRMEVETHFFLSKGYLSLWVYSSSSICPGCISHCHLHESFPEVTFFACMLMTVLAAAHHIHFTWCHYLEVKRSENMPSQSFQVGVEAHTFLAQVGITVKTILECYFTRFARSARIHQVKGLQNVRAQELHGSVCIMAKYCILVPDSQSST